MWGGVVAAIALFLAVDWFFWDGAPEAQGAPGTVTTEFADIPKIDVHVHVDPARAEAAVELFAEHGVVLALNASGGRPGVALDESVEAAERTDGRLRPYCNFDFSRVEDPGFAEYAEQQMAQCAEDGAVGLKIFKSLGLGYELSDGSLLAADDPRLDPVFEAAGRHNLVVLMHTGDPQAFFHDPDEGNERYEELAAHPSWSFYGRRPDSNGNWPNWDDVFDQFEARVARHPNTRFLGAHFGNAPEEPNRVARMMDRYSNLYVETGARVPELGRHDADRMRAIFERHHDRILFGTDMQQTRHGWILGSVGEDLEPDTRIAPFYIAHWRYFESRDEGFEHPTPIQGDWTIDGIGLAREILEDVYYRNAERLFGIELPEVEESE